MRKLNAVVMTLAGSLLIVAAVLKVHEVLTLYFPSWREHGVWESWEFFLAQVPVEFALGVWMVSGLFRKAAWLAGTVAYIFFAGVQVYNIMIGAESCGCFGRVEVDPWVTLLAIDIPIAALLLIFRPKGQKLLPPPWPNTGHAIATAVPIFAALILGAPLLVAFRPEFIKPEAWQTVTPPPRKPAVELKIEEPAEPEIAVAPKPDPVLEPKAPETPAEPDTEDTETQEPEVPDTPVPVEPTPDPVEEPAPDIEEPEVIDEPADVPSLWPWLAYVDIADELTDGIVIAYMYHHDCSVCAESIPKFERYSREMAAMGLEELKVAYLAIPPYGKEGTGPVPTDTIALRGKLTDQRRWAITSPFVVALLEGQVVKTWPQGTSPDPDTIIDAIFAP